MTVALITSRRSIQYNADPPRANIVAILILVGSLVIGGLLTAAVGSPIPIIAFAIAGVILMQSPRVAQQWERADSQESEQDQNRDDVGARRVGVVLSAATLCDRGHGHAPF